MKRVIVLMCILPILFLAGCKIDGEFWVKKSGDGHGILFISGIPGLTKSKLEAELGKDKDIKLTSVKEKGNEEFEVNFKWDDFNKAFKSRKVNKDGSIFLDFGKVEFPISSFTVHVDGKIDKETTKGFVKNSNTVIFSNGRATLVYRPGSALPLSYIVLFIVIGGIIGTILFLSKKRKHADQS